MFKKTAIISTVAGLLAVGDGAWAGQTSNTMNITASVNANCTVTTAPTDYSGTYDPVNANAATDLLFTQSIVFKCTKSSAGVTTGITQGANYSSGRRLKDSGTNYLNYNLYQPAAVGGAAACAYTQAFDTTGAGLFAVGSANFASASTLVTVKICGKVPAGQDVPATGAYTDAVIVNINF